MIVKHSGLSQTRECQPLYNTYALRNLARLFKQMSNVIVLDPPPSPRVERAQRRADRALMKAIRDSAALDYPNPDRNGCPKGVAVLKAIATKELACTDPVIQHVAECSPCFREVTQLRRDMQARKFFKAASAVLAITLTALLLKRR